MRPAHDQFAGLRGMLILWIVSGHLLLHEKFAGIYDAGFARHEDFGRLGDIILLRFLGVDIFFMLTGLVLTLHYFGRFGETTKGKDIDRFYLKRLKRVWPLHAAMVAVIALFHFAGIPHPISSGLDDLVFSHMSRTLLLNLVLMNGWGIFPVASWNEPAWSLSITFLLYVIFPNLLIVLKRIPPRTVTYGLLIAAFIITYALVREWTGFTSHSDGTGAIARGLFFCAIGSVTALYHRISKNDFWKHYGVLINLAFIGLVIVWIYVWQFPLTTFHFIYPLLLLAILRGDYHLLPGKIAQWLGSRSFALFMAHYPALLLVRHVLGPTLASWAADGMKIGAYILVVALILAVAEFAYRLFDRPFAR